MSRSATQSDLPFTDHVTGLAAGRKISPSAFDLAWSELKTVLSKELRRRGIWTAPTIYLGVLGSVGWRDTAALQELLNDCYVYIFIDRLPRLASLLRVHPDIEGLVHLNVKHFVHDRQKAHDPVGFRMYQVVKHAVEQLVASGQLAASPLDRVGASTLLRSFRENPTGQLPASPSEIERAVQDWPPQIFSQLFFAFGRDRRRALETLSEQIIALRNVGIEACHFKDLMSAVRQRARSELAALWIQGEDLVEIVNPQTGSLELIKLFEPETAYEEQEGLEVLVGRVRKVLESLQVQERTRLHLLSLLKFFERQASGFTPDGNRPLSQRQLALNLQIPRNSLPDLFSTLGEVIQDCRSRLRGRLR